MTKVRPRRIDAPTAEDPLIRTLSDTSGGPAGKRLRSPRPDGGRGTPRGFWTVSRILVALTVAAILLSVLSMQWCRVNGWGDQVGVYHHGCYSDISALFTQRALNVDPWGPFRGGDFEYPVLTSLIASVFAWMVPDGVDRGSLLYWDITFAFTAVVWIVLVLAVMKAAGRRPWDAAIVAVSPAIIFGAGINWDLWAVAALALAILAYTRNQMLVAGIFIGVGTSFKVFPLFMLGAVLVLALRSFLFQEEEPRSRTPDPLLRRLSMPSVVGFAKMLGATVGSWLALNVPAMLIGWEEWIEFYSFSSERDAGYSSIWHIWNITVGADGERWMDADAVSAWSFGLFFLSCVAVLVLGLMAPERPRMVQLLFLIVAAFMLFNKVYSPQFMVWLVPLIALAAPRWRDALIWQAAQVLHFWAIWMYLAKSVSQSEDRPQDAIPPDSHVMDDNVFVLSVLLHIGVTVYLMVRVVIDMYRPHKDIVRSSATSAAPSATSPAAVSADPAGSSAPRP